MVRHIEYNLLKSFIKNVFQKHITSFNFLWKLFKS